ncbi:unnamed protein product [Urochloa humidicola]
MDLPPPGSGMADPGWPWSRRTGVAAVDPVSTPSAVDPCQPRLVHLPPVDGHGSSGRGLENPRRPLPSSGAGEGEKRRDAPACLATERERDERDGAGHFNSLNALAKGPRLHSAINFYGGRCDSYCTALQWDLFIAGEQDRMMALLKSLRT